MEITSIDFRLLFDLVPDLYLLLNPDLTIAGVNKAYAQATMIKREEVIGRKLFDVFPDNPNDAHANGVSNLLNSLNFVKKNKQKHVMAVQQYDIRNQDGTFETRYWSPVNIPVLNSENEIDYIIHKAEDVTEFIRMKEEQAAKDSITEDLRQQILEMEIYKKGQELQQKNNKLEEEVFIRTHEIFQKERRFKALIENSHDITSLRGPKMELLYQSPSTDRILGWTLEERRASSNFSMVHPDDQKKLIDTFNKSLKYSHKTFLNTHRAIHKKGHYVWLEGTITNLLSDDSIQAVVLNFKDITARKEAEEQLKQSELLLRNTLGNMAEGVQIIGYDYRYLYVNEAVAKHGKSTIEELTGFTMMDKYPGIENTIVFKTIQRCMNERVPEYVENEFTYPDGSKGWFELRMHPVPEGLYILSMDINERKQSELDMATKNKKLLIMNKELEQFAYVASHDLQEPLRTLISYTDLIQKEFGGKLGPFGDKYVEFILQSSNRMRDLVKGLLDYSRIGKEKELAHIDCNKILEEVMADMTLVINENTAKITSDRLPNLNAYSVEIRQLFQNLLSNALKFRKENTLLNIYIGANEKENEWLFYFKDNGIGIEKKHQDKIFIIFKRLHNRDEYEGTGIGLAHCKKIVDFHGGNIWVDSELGVGSTFYFTIPKL